MDFIFLAGIKLL